MYETVKECLFTYVGKVAELATALKNANKNALSAATDRALRK